MLDAPTTTEMSYVPDLVDVYTNVLELRVQGLGVQDSGLRVEGLSVE